MKVSELARILNGLDNKFEIDDIVNVDVNFKLRRVKLYFDDKEELKPFIDHD